MFYIKIHVLAAKSSSLPQKNERVMKNDMWIVWKWTINRQVLREMFIDNIAAEENPPPLRKQPFRQLRPQSLKLLQHLQGNLCSSQNPIFMWKKLKKHRKHFGVTFFTIWDIHPTFSTKWIDFNRDICSNSWITFYNAGGTILKLLFEDAFLGSDYWLEASKPSFMTVFPQVVIFILLSMAVVTFLFLSLTNSLALAIPLKTSLLIALTPSRFCNWAYRNKSKYLVVSFFLYRFMGLEKLHRQIVGPRWA